MIPANFLIGTAALLAAAFMSATADAAIVIATYTGTVAFAGYDTTGVFGRPARDLEGLPFTGTLTYETNLGSRSGTPGFSDVLVGGPDLGYSNPLVDSTLTISGVTVHIPANGYFQAFAGDDFAQHVVRGYVPSSPRGPNNFTRFELIARPAGARPNLTYPFGPVDSLGNGYFEIFDYDDVGGTGFRKFANGQLNVATVSIRLSVPEPSTWALMLSGFGICGASLRRSKRTQSVFNSGS